MLYNFQRKKLCSHLLVGGALLAASFGIYSCSDKYDLDTEQPSNLNSIYGYLQEQGNFTTCLRLIDDLGLTDVLSKTGSKTMFIANDEAFANFFKSNDWGVTSYDNLTTTQKTLLLNSAMIDNPYSTSMLSTAEGPTKGEVCRRSSSLTLYDSVLTVKSKSAEALEVLPKNARFNEIQANHDTIVLYTDASNSAPMVHFTYKFLSTNKLESTDVDFLYNDPDGTRKNDDVYVNNAKVINSNIFCKNGFIHQVDRVITPLDNMAEVIRKDPETTIYSSLLDRFAAPAFDKTLTDAYNTNKKTNVDSVFNKRYFSDRSDGSTREADKAFDTDKNGATFDASLKYDPGWNGYMPLTGDPRDAMMEDMAVMLVPTDSAFNIWFNDGAGKVIKEYYGSIDAVPNSVFDDLLRVNQLTSLVSSVPSRFNDVLNDANERLGLERDSVKEVKLGCNGVVYKTRNVFAPTSYSSVLFPAVIDTTNFKIIENAISCMDYDKYLNSMVSKYIFLIPTNDGLLSYIDPVSYGTTTSQLWEFHYDASKAKAQRIYADVYKCELDEDGKWNKVGDRIYQVKNQNVSTLSTVLYDRMQNLLDNIIVTTAYEPGQRFYKTKGNSFVRIDGIYVGDNVWGSEQLQHNTPLAISRQYKMDNGYALVLDGPIMGTNKSVAMALEDEINSVAGDESFSDFFNIMKVCGILNTTNQKDGWAASDYTNGNIFNIKTYGDIGAEDKPSSSSSTKKASYILNNYQYTIYAPTNAAMQKAYAAGLPTIEDLQIAEDSDALEDLPSTSPDSRAGKILEAMLDFVKYHIQDNSIFVDGSETTTGSYESAKTELIPSTNVAEAGTYTYNNDGVDSKHLGTITMGGNVYDINSWPEYSKWDESKNWNGTVSVEYKTGKYSPGRPYKITTSSSSSGMTVKDNMGETHNVIKKDGMYNIMAEEYWYGSSYDGTGSKAMSTTANPYQYFIVNSSSVVIQGIDGPLLYDAPDQFTYKYKQLTQEAKRR